MRVPWDCANKAVGEALAYIRQLEVKNDVQEKKIKKLEAKKAKLLETIEWLKRERDALVEDLSNCDGNCHFCDWFGDTGCVAPDDGKQPKHTHDCPFKWRGVKDTRTGASDSCTGASCV